MKLLVVAATKMEIARVLEHFHLPDEQFIENPLFDILITGVGMTATAFALGSALKKPYELVLNVGVAGSFNQDIPLGTLVNIEADSFAELGAEDHEHFLTIEELGLGNSGFKATFTLDNLPKVKAITVNKVHGNATSISLVQQRFNPQVESMEGAAVFYACNKLNIPCAQVRAISNYVEPRARENWQLGLAIKNLNEWLIDYISTIIK